LAAFVTAFAGKKPFFGHIPVENMLDKRLRPAQLEFHETRSARKSQA